MFRLHAMKLIIDEAKEFGDLPDILVKISLLWF
jgi:hypothetical protein